MASFQANAQNNGPGLIVTDLPVTHSLVSIVLGETGSPELLMKGSASPHDYALRPSDATHLQSAALLVWISRELTPWLSSVLTASRTPIENMELMDAPDTIRLPFRINDAFVGEHAHRRQHTEVRDSHQDHAEEAIDPHGWLDPVNGIYWLGLIADKISSLDPANATTYQRNAAAAQTQLMALQQTITGQLADVSGKPFVVFHDSYHYFEDRFNVFATAAIALSDAQMPGIRRMNKLKQQLKTFSGACVFTEPQFNDRLVNSLTRGIPLSTGSLDPLGTNFQVGTELYANVLRQIANELESCLAGIDLQ